MVAILSGDAHFTVSESAEIIVDAGADYLLAVKENQPTLHAEMENFFDQAHAAEWEEVPHLFHQTVEKDRGRIETREVRVVEDLSWLPCTGKWKNLACLVAVYQYVRKNVQSQFEKDYFLQRQCRGSIRHMSATNNKS